MNVSMGSFLLGLRFGLIFYSSGVHYYAFCLVDWDDYRTWCVYPSPFSLIVGANSVQLLEVYLQNQPRAILPCSQ